MTTEDIIRLTRQVGGSAFDHTVVFTYEEVRRFMDLVAAAERDRMIADGWRQCAQGQKTSQFCAVAEQARAEEREACARVADEADKYNRHISREIAAAIRARGQPDPKVTHLNAWARDRLARHGIQIPEDEEYGNPSF
jgi:hypothetical protein